MKKITKFLAAILIFAAVTANAGNPVGTLNLTRQGQTVTGNNGDVQFAFGGVLAEVFTCTVKVFVVVANQSFTASWKVSVVHQITAGAVKLAFAELAPLIDTLVHHV